MGTNRNPQVRTIAVHEIQLEKTRLRNLEKSEINAKRELRAFVKDVCRKEAFTLKGLAKYFKEARHEGFSENLFEFIKRKSIGELKKVLDKIIVKEHAGYSCSFTMYGGWSRVNRPVVWPFPRYFYYYEKEHVNLYTAKDEDLPLYMNREWEDTDEHELYMHRMRNLGAN